MQVQVAEIWSHGAPIILAVVPSEFTTADKGPWLIERIQSHRPTHPIMLVSVEDNGPRAYAFFETHILLALVQLENITLDTIDLNSPLPEPEMPF